MMPWMGSREASIKAEIARLEAEVARLSRLHAEDVPDIHPASSEAYQGRLAIRQSIAGAQEQIAFLRRG